MTTRGRANPANNTKNTQAASSPAPRFRVLRSFDRYKTREIIEEGADWPFGRARLLVKQRYLMPVPDEAPAIVIAGDEA